MEKYGPAPPVSGDIKNSFHIYPNPSDGKFTLEAGNISAGENMDVKDISGKTILQLKLSANKTVVDLSEYPPGIYFLYLNGKGCGKVAVY